MPRIIRPPTADEIEGENGDKSRSFHRFFAH